MRTEINTQLINDLLNKSCTKLKPSTLDVLRKSRTLALDHQRAYNTNPAFAWIGGQYAKVNSHHQSKSVNLAVAALFVACLISGATFWRNYSTEHEICEVDVAILTDVMPLHVYMD